MSTVEQSIDVEAPISTVYNQWTQFEEFPRFMDGIEQIRQSDDRHLHWVAEFGGSRHEWDAEIVEQSPEERVAWRNTDGKDNAGVVTFHKLADDRTRVMVQMDWAPDGVKEQLGSVLGFDTRRIAGDLPYRGWWQRSVCLGGRAPQRPRMAVGINTFRGWS